MLLRWFQIWRLSVKTLLLHPMRSLLTVLGIFIGVASVIWLLAIGEGISLKAQQQIESLGATNIIVRSVKPTDGSLDNDDFFFAYGLLRSDYDAIRTTIPSIKHALRIREIRRGLYYGQFNIEARVVGCSPRYREMMKLSMARGRFLSDTDGAQTKNVCVLAHESAALLFPLEDPIGKTVRLDEPYFSDAFTVVGVTKSRNPTAGIGGSLSAQEFNQDIYIPLETFWDRIGDAIYVRRAGSRSGEIVELNQITLQVESMDEVASTATAVRELMKKRHETNDYAVVVPQELLEQAKATRLMFMVFMGLMAAISLVVGGIGIMNIMLATVTERTREIGIRRALGAKRRDITIQFLIETVVLSIVGGVTGILIGLTCPTVVSWTRDALQNAFPETMENMPEIVNDITPVIVPLSIPLAFGISVVVGVVFGIYPAIRAASMDPIDALRHE